ncbi:MAG: hypothetical protein Q9218_004123 [Villophora microphyllina]
MAGPASPSIQEGPSEAPPQLPEGWLAQWEGQSRKYYYVQRATGHSQWDIPTQPALSVPTPDPTPQPIDDPFNKPPMSSERGPNEGSENYEGADRGFLSDLATNAMGGKHGKPQNQSGLGGLASSFLGGQGSHGSSGHGGSGGGLAGQLIGGLLGGGKPHNQQQPQPSQHSTTPGGYGSSSGGHQQGGLGSFFGGHHGQARTTTSGTAAVTVPAAVATLAQHLPQHTNLPPKHPPISTDHQADNITLRANLRNNPVKADIKTTTTHNTANRAQPRPNTLNTTPPNQITPNTSNPTPEHNHPPTAQPPNKTTTLITLPSLLRQTQALNTPLTIPAPTLDMVNPLQQPATTPTPAPNTPPHPKVPHLPTLNNKQAPPTIAQGTANLRNTISTRLRNRP